MNNLETEDKPRKSSKTYTLLFDEYKSIIIAKVDTYDAIAMAISSLTSKISTSYISIFSLSYLIIYSYIIRLNGINIIY